MRWDYEFITCRENTEMEKVHATVKDLLSGREMTIVFSYLCGADGAHSVVARELQLPVTEKPGGGFALNIWFEADLALDSVRHGFGVEMNHIYEWQAVWKDDEQAPPPDLPSTTQMTQPSTTWKLQIPGSDFHMLRFGHLELEQVNRWHRRTTWRAKANSSYSP
ncbi:hypothetical protein GGR57DRAFT_503549 [Xylariaceae sp. FL1272]|nr:hypothetical protein GGR57DRAFT_503549 [Xylariaceae sp. FL1272]